MTVEFNRHAPDRVVIEHSGCDQRFYRYQSGKQSRYLWPDMELPRESQRLQVRTGIHTLLEQWFGIGVFRRMRSFGFQWGWFAPTGVHGRSYKAWSCYRGVTTVHWMLRQGEVCVGSSRLGNRRNRRAKHIPRFRISELGPVCGEESEVPGSAHGTIEG